MAAGAPQDATATRGERGDQTDLAVTVYNASLALVRDVREFALPAGESDLRFVDIAATVNPATVHFRSLTDPSRVGVLEQNYEYDLLDPDKLLRKYVGREVTLMRTRVENGTTKQDAVKATLVSYNNGPIWKVGDEYVTGLGADHIRFPELPSNLYSRPTLVWKLLNRGGPRHRIEASYLAGGLSWQSDYVLTVGRDDASADLDGWVTLTNQSGTAFRDARLQFVAGDLNRVQPAARKMAMDMIAEAKAMPASMAQEAFSEYHLYTLGRRTTIANQETKQLALLNGTGVPVEKRYVVDGQAFYYRNRHSPGTPLKDNVQVFYRFRNDATSGLGAPMPAGVIRVYQADAQRRPPVRRRGSDRPHAEGRDDRPEDRQRLRHRLRAEPDGLREDQRPGLRDGVRHHAAQPQDDADRGAGQRTRRRHVADAAIDARVGEDGGVGGAVHGAGGGGRHVHPEVPQYGSTTDRTVRQRWTMAARSAGRSRRRRAHRPGRRTDGLIESGPATPARPPRRTMRRNARVPRLAAANETDRHTSLSPSVDPETAILGSVGARPRSGSACLACS